MLPFVIPPIYSFGIQAMGEYTHDKHVWYKVLLSENKLSFVWGKMRVSRKSPDRKTIGINICQMEKMEKYFSISLKNVE